MSSVEEAYQRGHEDGYWAGKTTDMSPAEAAAFMAPYRAYSTPSEDTLREKIEALREALVEAQTLYAEIPVSVVLADINRALEATK